MAWPQNAFRTTILPKDQINLRSQKREKERERKRERERDKRKKERRNLKGEEEEENFFKSYAIRFCYKFNQSNKSIKVAFK